MSVPALEFSHIGIFVTDLARMRDFYTRVLGLLVTDEGTLGPRRLVFLSRDPGEHHQLVLVDGRPQEGLFNVVNQISFRAARIDDLRQFHVLLAQEPGIRDLVAVSHGISVSVYCLDPEGNRIELFVDCPWYVDQPLREPIDIDRPEAEVLAEVRARIERHPSFRPAEAWRAELAAQLGPTPD